MGKFNQVLKDFFIAIYLKKCSVFFYVVFQALIETLIFEARKCIFFLSVGILKN